MKSTEERLIALELDLLQSCIRGAKIAIDGKAFVYAETYLNMAETILDVLAKLSAPTDKKEEV